MRCQASYKDITRIYERGVRTLCSVEAIAFNSRKKKSNSLGPPVVASQSLFVAAAGVIACKASVEILGPTGPDVGDLLRRPGLLELQVS